MEAVSIVQQPVAVDPSASVSNTRIESVSASIRLTIPRMAEESQNDQNAESDQESPYQAVSGTDQQRLAALLQQGTFSDDVEVRRADLDRVVSWLQEKWGSGTGACPYCGTNKWSVGAQIQLATIKSLPDGGGEFRALSSFIPVGCSNCGQTTFINADFIDGSTESDGS